MVVPKHLVLWALIWLGFALVPPSLAQTPNPAEASPPAAQQPDVVPALNGILDTLRNDADRTAFIQQLEQLRDSLAARSRAASGAADQQAAAEDEARAQEGLLGAIAAGLTNIGRSVRLQVETGAVQGRLSAAGGQIYSRLAVAWQTGGLFTFLIWALSGWAIGAALLYGLSLLKWLRPMAIGHRPQIENRHDLFRIVGLDLVRRLLPVAVVTALIFAWPALIPRGWQEARLFLAVATPLLAGAAVWRLGQSLLLLIGPLRGWQIVRYARRRVLPWLVAMAVLALFGSTMRDPDIRWIIGPDVSLLSAYALDLTLAVVAVLFIIRRRKGVQRLLVRRRGAQAQVGLLHNLALHLAANWHLLGFALIAGHLVTSLFHLGRGSFFGLALLTLGTIGVIMAVTFALSGFVGRIMATPENSRSRNRGGLVRRLEIRFLGVFRILLRTVAAVAIVVIGLQIWNVDLLAWMSHGIGLAIFRPIISIAVALLVGWVVWILVDTAVEYALSPTDHGGPMRDHSTRARTLLPMLRNFAFIVLCALTIIAVMSNLGINVAPLLAGAGVIGLAISFGSQQLVQDVITGLFMLIEDTIAIGDTIDTGDRAGVVESVTIRTVRVRDGDGALHTIPFSTIKALKNRSRGFGVYTVKVVVGYDADLQRVMAIMNEVGDELRDDPAFSANMLGGLSIWGVDQFTPEGITIMGGLRTRALQQWGVGRAFNLRLKQRFDAEGIPLTPPRPTMMIPSRAGWPEPESGPESGSEAQQTV